MPLNSSFIAYHTDIARGAYMRPDAFKQVLAHAADSGFTHVVPYLENMIKLPAMAKACPSCAYTPEVWQDFQQTAINLGIELVPHFNVIGHSQQICQAYPELAGELDSVEMDVTTEVAQTWTRQALSEYCEFSRSEWFLIGGDEWLAPRHLLQNPLFNVARAWADQINLAVEVLKQYNRTPIVWHDMLMHYPEALELVSKDAVIAFWFYDVDSDYAAIRLLQDHGFRVIMASGLSGGYVSERRILAAQQGVAAVEKYDADGYMITSWEKQRFESQKLITQAIGRIVRGEEPLPEVIVQTESLRETYRGFETPLPALNDRLEEMKQWLKDPAWDSFPKHRACQLAWLEQDAEADLASYVKYHYPEGPFYDYIRQGKNIAPLYRGNGLHLEVDEAEPEGVMLLLCNGRERLRLYPRFGPTLQDWAIGEYQIIPHTLPAFLKRGRPQGGGYRSYSAVGGLRPIWALGTHHNPCILWQYKWDWNVLEETAERIVVELTQSFHHVDMRYRLTMVAGQPGFLIELDGVNKLPHARVGYNWNIVLDFNAGEIPHAIFKWDAEGDTRTLRVAEQLDGAFMVPAAGDLTFATSKYELLIQPETASTHGYFVDWGLTCITPDLRSNYRPVAEGETLSTRWRFTAKTPPQH